MDRREDYLGKLRRRAEWLQRNRHGIEAPPPARESRAPDPAAQGLGDAADMESSRLEAIVRWYRPVLYVKNDRIDPERGPGLLDPRFVDPNAAAAAELINRLEARRDKLDPVVRSVGRIETKNNVNYPWVGTGWIVDNDLDTNVVITNAHVAGEFARRSGTGFVFRAGIPNSSVLQQVRMDFREELSDAPAREFPILDVLWMSEDPSLDMALLRVARRAGQDEIDGPIRLLTSALTSEQMIAVLGYPGSNNGYDLVPFQQLFGVTLGTKRCSPGFVMNAGGSDLNYDCSTLPGSSGSVVLDVETGGAVGLHFAGTAFETNYAVPAATLAKVLRNRPWAVETTVTSLPPVSALPSGVGATSTPAIDPCAVTVRFPLDITVRLGQASLGTLATPVLAVARGGEPTAAAIEAATKRVEEHVRGLNGILGVGADYLFVDGQLSERRGIVVRVSPGASMDREQYGLPDLVDGVEIVVETADPETIVTEQLGLVREAFGGRQAAYERDLDDARFALNAVTDEMSIVLHLSPDAGWPVLQEFLGREDANLLVIGMYHMTAPHVVEALAGVARRDDSRMVLTLDRQKGDAEMPDDISAGTKANDIPEAETIDALNELAGPRFRWAPASLGASGLFPTAYHIKVAVWGTSGAGGDIPQAHRFWLSSGNWQSSNVAPIGGPPDGIDVSDWNQVKAYNREWHAVVEHAGLAQTMLNHLLQDFEDNTAAAEREVVESVLPDVLVPLEKLAAERTPRGYRPIAPLRLQGRIKVQPLLTPDNYAEVVRELIEGAQERIWIENQSFTLWKTIEETPEHFRAIVEAVKAQQRAGLDVRIIFRSGFGNEREVLRRMKRFGLQVGKDDVRFFSTCHTKGMIIDSDVVLLGSQNWTAAGTGPNRDASLVVWGREANAYFEKAFEFDWKERGEHVVVTTEGMSEAVRFVPAGAEAVVPRGYRRIALDEFLGET